MVLIQLVKVIIITIWALVSIWLGDLPLDHQKPMVGTLKHWLDSMKQVRNIRKPIITVHTLQLHATGSSMAGLLYVHGGEAADLIQEKTKTENLVLPGALFGFLVDEANIFISYNTFMDVITLGRTWNMPVSQYCPDLPTNHCGHGQITLLDLTQLIYPNLYWRGNEYMGNEFIQNWRIYAPYSLRGHVMESDEINLLLSCFACSYIMFHCILLLAAILC